MMSRERKRNSKELITAPQTNPLIACHDYVSLPATTLSVAMATEDFPPLPSSTATTPSKSPISKKALFDSDNKDKTVDATKEIIGTLSQLINTRSEEIKAMVNENSMKIEGLKKSVDFAFQEIQDIKGRMNKVEDCHKKDQSLLSEIQKRVEENERYSRRWNLKLHGVPETVSKEKIKDETIKICQAILPEKKSSLPDVIDTAHRVGKKPENSSKPRGIILQFTSRSTRDAVWKAAKNHPFLQEHHLRLAEDLSPADRERRAALWPAIQKARNEGKIAYYFGARAFVDGKEIVIDQSTREMLKN